MKKRIFTIAIVVYFGISTAAQAGFWSDVFSDVKAYQNGTDTYKDLKRQEYEAQRDLSRSARDYTANSTTDNYNKFLQAQEQYDAAKSNRSEFEDVLRLSPSGRDVLRKNKDSFGF